jgi:hypothetical protein
MKRNIPSVPADCDIISFKYFKGNTGCIFSPPRTGWFSESECVRNLRMGSTESSPTVTSPGHTFFGRTHAYRCVRNKAAVLTRSPSAPAGIMTSLQSPHCDTTRTQNVVKSPSQVPNDETAKVTMLADGSFAFFRVHQKLPSAKQGSTAHLLSNEGSVLS